MELGEIRLICTTTALNYGVDYQFDYGVFTSSRYLTRSDFIQFAGRVGRRNHGVVYVTFDPDKLPDVRSYKPTESDVDFARFIALDRDYICGKYGICDNLVTLAFHLIHPADAKKIIDAEYLRVDDDNYRLCFLASIMKSSIDVDPECNEYGIVADRSLMDLFRRALNLKLVGFGEYKVLQEASYKSHILGILKDSRFDDISLALKYAIPLSNVNELVKLIDIPYIGRMRAYQLYQRGVTRDNVCENIGIVRKVVGKKIAEKIFQLFCTSKLSS